MFAFEYVFGFGDLEVVTEDQCSTLKDEEAEGSSVIY